MGHEQLEQKDGVGLETKPTNQATSFIDQEYGQKGAEADLGLVRLNDLVEPLI